MCECLWFVIFLISFCFCVCVCLCFMLADRAISPCTVIFNFNLCYSFVSKFGMRILYLDHVVMLFVCMSVFISLFFFSVTFVLFLVFSFYSTCIDFNLIFNFIVCINANTIWECSDFANLVVVMVFAFTNVLMVLNNGSICCSILLFSVSVFSINLSKLCRFVNFYFCLWCFCMCYSLVRLYLSFVCSVCICVYVSLFFILMLLQIELISEFRSVYVDMVLVIFHQVWWWVVVAVVFDEIIWGFRKYTSHDGFNLQLSRLFCSHWMDNIILHLYFT